MFDNDDFEPVMGAYSYEQTWRNKRALEYINTNTTLLQAFALEPRLFDLVRRVNSIERLESRDAAYSQFKHDLIQLVGREAAKLELQTTQHYEAMVNLLAHLLSWYKEQPRLVETEEEESSEAISVDAVVRQTMDASREATLQAFRPLVEQQRQRNTE